jgi:subtilisin
MTDDGSDTRLTRRHYLGVLGTASAAAVIGGASSAASATEHGYGGSGYGTGQYGGDEPVTDPVLKTSTVGTESIDTTSATLVGDLTTLDSADTASVYFEWGPSTEDLPNQTATETVRATGEFDATVSDLESDTDYEYRAVATADGTTATGGSLTFRTDRVEGTPTIDRLTGVDVSNPRNPHVDAELEWAASIDQSELYAAELTLSDPDGELESWQYDLSGTSAGATATERLPHRARESDTAFTAHLVVYSYYGHVDESTITFTAQ